RSSWTGSCWWCGRARHPGTCWPRRSKPWSPIASWASSSTAPSVPTAGTTAAIAAITTTPPSTAARSASSGAINVPLLLLLECAAMVAASRAAAFSLVPALAVVAAPAGGGGCDPRRHRSLREIGRRWPCAVVPLALLLVSGCAVRAGLEGERLAAGLAASVGVLLPLRAFGCWAIGRSSAERVLVLGAGPLAHSV